MSGRFTDNSPSIKLQKLLRRCENKLFHILSAFMVADNCDFPMAEHTKKSHRKKTTHEILFSIRCRKIPIQLTAEFSLSSSRDQIQNRAIRNDKKDFPYRSHLEETGQNRGPFRRMQKRNGPANGVFQNMKQRPGKEPE